MPNSRTKEKLIVGRVCIINYKKALEQLGSANNVLFFPTYRKLADNLNAQYGGTAKIVEFPSQLGALAQLLNQPDVDFKTVKHILDVTRNDETQLGKDIFDRALDMYVDRRYYYYDDPQYRGNYNDWQEIVRDQVERDLEEYWSGDNYESLDLEEPLDLDDACPEGTGFDEIDWESHDQ